jgi:hypothetical protein
MYQTISFFPTLTIGDRKIKTGPSLKIAGIFALLVILSFLAVLIYQLNIYTAEIYFIYNSERKIGQLSQENRVLEINLARANSLWNVEKYVQNFEETDKIEYVRVLEDTVLAK